MKLKNLKKESPLAVPFNQGFICPRCLDVCIGEKWKEKLKYCPRCGQRIVFMEPGEWLKLKNKVKKTEGAIESDIVEMFRYEDGLDIAGVYIDEFNHFIKQK